jgi:RNA polymerase sigma-70 factor, ECF subfamily
MQNALRGGAPRDLDKSTATMSLFGADSVEGGMMDQTGGAEAEGCFVELYLRHQREIYSFIVQLVRDYDDSEDLLQKTGVILWRKFDQFEPGTSFLAWARKIARFEVQTYLRSKRRDRVCFSSETIDLLAEEIEKDMGEGDRRHEALLGCLEQLRTSDRELTRQCYARGASIRHVAEAAGRSVDGVYQSLRRIRRTLLSCIRRQLAAETLP